MKTRKIKTGLKAGDVYLHMPRGGNNRLNDGGPPSGTSTATTAP
jgi:hypothetical protein